MALLFKIYTPHFDGVFFSCKTRILGTEIIFRVAENKQQDSFKSQKINKQLLLAMSIYYSAAGELQMVILTKFFFLNHKEI